MTGPTKTITGTNKTHKLKILVWNPCGFQANISTLNRIHKLHELDVILIQEALYSKTTPPKFLNFYGTLSEKNPKIRNHQNLALFNTKTIEAIDIKKLNDPGFPIQQIELRQKGASQNITITNVYITHDCHYPTSMQNLTDIISETTNNIVAGDFNASIDPKDKNYGQKNDPLKTFVTNNQLYNPNPHFTPTNTQKTQSNQPPSKRTIDYIFTDQNISGAITNHQIIGEGNLHKDGKQKQNYHSPQILELEYKTSQTTRKTLNYSKYNTNTYQQDLKKILEKEEYREEPINNKNDLEKEAQKITDCLMEAIHKQLKPEVAEYKEGWTPSRQLANLIRKKERAFQKMTKAVNFFATLKWEEEFHTLQSQIFDLEKKELQKHKENMHEKFKNEHINGAKFWKETKKLAGLIESSPTCEKLIYKGTKAWTEEQKAELHLKYQESVFQENTPNNCTNCNNCTNGDKCEDVKQFWDTNIIPKYEEGQRLINKNMRNEVPPVTTAEFNEALRRCKKLKAGGMDDMKYICIHDAIPQMKERIRSLYSHCLRLGYQPQKWKHAIIILLPKPGKDHSKPDGYRPISLLMVLGKLFDKIISKRYRNFLNASKNEKNEPTIPPDQKGFSKIAQTSDLIHRLQQTITGAAQRGNQTLIAALDATKAFDKAPHKAILAQISALVKTKQMPEYILDIYTDFLHQRTFQIRYGNSLTKSTGKIQAGVPQGSVSAPHLYIHLTASIPRPGNHLNTQALAAYAQEANTCIKQNIKDEVISKLQNHNQKLGLFADDINVWSEIEGSTAAYGYYSNNTTIKNLTRKIQIKRLQLYLQQIYIWANRLKIHFNQTKNQLMMTKNIKTKKDNNKSQLPKITLGPMIIKYTNELKYLGITFDQTMKLTSYLKEITLKARQRTGRLKNLAEKANISPIIAIRWMDTFVVSLLRYGVAAWLADPDKCKKMNQLQKNTRRAAYRVPLGTRTTSLELQFMHEEKDFLTACNNQLQKWYQNADKNNTNMHNNFETDMDLLIKNTNMYHKGAKITSNMALSRYQSNMEILHRFYTTDKHLTKLTDHQQIQIMKNFNTHKVPKKNKQRKTLTSTKKVKRPKKRGTPPKEKKRKKR